MGHRRDGPGHGPAFKRHLLAPAHYEATVRVLPKGGQSGFDGGRQEMVVGIEKDEEGSVTCCDAGVTCSSGPTIRLPQHGGAGPVAHNLVHGQRGAIVYNDGLKVLAALAGNSIEG